MSSGIKIESCCGSLLDVIEAEKGGASRVELNSCLFFGGLTPSLGTFLEAKKRTSKVKIICMVRPRSGGFFYTEEEYQSMLMDAKLFLQNGADGIAFGFLNEDGTVDENRTREMVCLIGNKEAVFHRAFDMTPCWKEAMDTLISCKVNRILTSGQKKSAYDGKESIREMVKYADGRIEILPGAGITSENVVEIIQDTGCTEVHMSRRKTYEDRSLLQNPEISFSGNVIPDEKEHQVIDAIELQKVAWKLSNL